MNWDTKKNPTDLQNQEGGWRGWGGIMHQLLLRGRSQRPYPTADQISAQTHMQVRDKTTEITACQ